MYILFFINDLTKWQCTPSLSPTGGEGARKAGEGDSAWFMVPIGDYNDAPSSGAKERQLGRQSDSRVKFNGSAAGEVGCLSQAG